MPWFHEFLKTLIVIALTQFCQAIDSARSLESIRRNCAAVLAVVQAILALIGLASAVPASVSAIIEYSLSNAKEHLECICNGRVVGTYAYHIRHAHRNLAAARDASSRT